MNIPVTIEVSTTQDGFTIMDYTLEGYVKRIITVSTSVEALGILQKMLFDSRKEYQTELNSNHIGLPAIESSDSLPVYKDTSKLKTKKKSKSKKKLKF